MTAPRLPLCLNAFNGSPYLGVPENLTGWIEAAARSGFPLVSLDRYSLDAYIARGDTLASLASMLRGAGIGCGAITAVGMLDGSDHTDELLWAAAAAEALGARFLQVNVATPDRSARIRAVEQACDAIDGRGIKLAIEYLPFTPLNSIVETVEIAQRVGVERAGAMIDIWHHSFGPDDWARLEGAPLEAIAYVEIDDAPPLQTDDLAGETLSRRVYPGDGIFDIDRFLNLISTKGYQGMVSVEILSDAWRARSPSDQAEAAYHGARRFLP